MSSKIFGTIVCCFIAVVFIFISLILTVEAKNIIVPYFFWKTVQCKVDLVSIERISSRTRPYKVNIGYNYEYQGNRYTSGRIYAESLFSPKSYETYKNALAFSVKYPANSYRAAYINPARPSEVILEHGPLANLFVCTVMAAIFGVTGLLLGFIGLYAIWLGKPVGDTNNPSAGEAVTKESWWLKENRWVKAAGLLLVALFIGIFGVAGIYVCYRDVFLPLKRTEETRYWALAKCKIISSSVIDIGDGDSAVYVPDIFYSYIYKRKEYRSSQYEVHRRTRGYRISHMIADHFKLGHYYDCYVNPVNPGESVLSRTVPRIKTKDYILPLIFILIGFGGALLALKAAVGTVYKRKKSMSDWLPNQPTVPDVISKDAVSSLTHALDYDVPTRRKWGFRAHIALAMFSTLFCFLWFQGILGWWRGGFNIFALVFALFSLPVAGVFFWSWIKAFQAYWNQGNPFPVVTLVNSKVPLGGNLTFSWKIEGNLKKLKNIAIALEGVEQATKGSGEYEETKKNVFCRVVLKEMVMEDFHFVNGLEKYLIPEEMGTSFESKHNTIKWHVRFSGECQACPPLDESFPIEITTKGKRA